MRTGRILAALGKITIACINNNNNKTGTPYSNQ